MKYGLILPRLEPGGAPLARGTLEASARRIEKAGFHSAWITDSIGRGVANPEPLTTLAVVAAVTEKIHVGTGILQVPIREAVDLAHRVMTTHLIAGDRLDLGIGVGSAQTDFRATGTQYDRRFRQFEESVGIMRQLWNGETVRGITLTPWPETVGGPRLLIGSWSGSKWVPRAAREFDGWISSAKKSSRIQLEDGLRRYRDAGGQRAIALNLDVDCDAPDRERDPSEPMGACSPRIAAERIARFIDLGFDEIVLRTQQHTDESVARVAALAGLDASR